MNTWITSCFAQVQVFVRTPSFGSIISGGYICIRILFCKMRSIPVTLYYNYKSFLFKLSILLISYHMLYSKQQINMKWDKANENT